MLERPTSDLWQSIKLLNTELAAKYVDLAIDILAGKQLAEPEFFPLQTIPGNLLEQAATLLRHALVLDPECDKAHYQLGMLFLRHKIISLMADQFPIDIMWDYSQNACDSKATLCFRRALSFDGNSHAYIELGRLILNGKTLPQPSDFPEGEFNPHASLAEHAATLFRVARRFNSELGAPLFELGKLIEAERIDFHIEDYTFETLMNDKKSHAAAFYRTAIHAPEPVVHAKAYLANLIAAGVVKAINEDYAPFPMPEGFAEQAKYLYLEVLKIDSNCFVSMFGLAKLIIRGLIDPPENLNNSDIASPAEQAATLLRRVLTLEPDHPEVTLELADLLLERKVKLLPSEANLVSRFYAIELMIQRILRTGNANQPAKDFLLKIEDKQKQFDAECLEREKKARSEREANSARQAEEKLKTQQEKLQAKQQKSAKAVRKANDLTPSSSSSSLFAQQKKLRLTKEKETKPSPMLTTQGIARRTG
jgi:hypothetical protein